MQTENLTFRDLTRFLKRKENLGAIASQKQRENDIPIIVIDQKDSG